MEEPAGGGASGAVALRPVAGVVIPSEGRDAPPPSLVARPAGILDLPPELLVRVVGHLWAISAAHLTDAVPSPALGPWAMSSADQDEPTTPPLVTAHSWMAMAGVARVCRAFRQAFLSSVEYLRVEVGGGEAARGELGAVIPRWAALAATLRRLTSLRTLDLRLGALRPPWVLHMVTNMVADILGSGTPSLRALSLVSTEYLDVTVRRMAAGQPRLAHLALFLTAPATADAFHLADLYEGMAGRLQSMDLRSLSSHSESAATAFLRRLPTLGAVRAVHLDGGGWGSEAGLTALAAICPAVEALTVDVLAPELRSGAGATALLRLFPFLHTLAVGAPDDGSLGEPVPLSFVAALCVGRRFTTLVLPGLVSGAEPLQLVQALAGGQQPPVHLRLNGLVKAPTVAGLRGGSLSTLTALHLSFVKLDREAVAALTSLSSLVALSLGGALGHGNALVLEEDVLSTLCPPNLRHLDLKHAELGGMAGAGLVAAMARMTPQTLRSLSLAACVGEISAAIYALVGLNSFRRLGLIGHQVEGFTYKGSSSYKCQLVDAAASCRAARAFMTAHRPDVVFSGGE